MATNLQTMKDKGTAVAKTDFPAMLLKYKAEIARALPSHITPDRMSRIALTAFRLNPKLEECEPASVFAAVVMSSQLGLEIGVQGRSYLVPYKVNKKTPQGWESHYECQFIPGWKGLVDLMTRSGQGAVWTGAVFEGDQFEWELGDSPYVKHKPKGEYDADKLTHVYAVGAVKGAEHKILEVWPVGRVKKHRDRYNKVGDRHYSFENWEMYARKVVLLQVLKYMPMSAELATAVALDDSATMGRQGLNPEGALDGSWVPVPDDDQGEGNADNSAGSSGAGGASGSAALVDIQRDGGATGTGSTEKDAGEGRGAETGNVAQSQGNAPKNFMEMSPAEYVDRINKAETITRIDEINDIARSRKDFNEEDKAFIAAAVKDWKANHAPKEKETKPRRNAVD